MQSFFNHKFSMMIKCFIFFSLLTSCSTIEFSDNGQKHFNVSSVAESEKVVTIYGTADFYFWGMLPGVSKINLDDAFFEQGVHEPSMVKIERVSTLQSVFYSLVTLGLYLPEPYRISVYSKKERVQ